MTSPITKQGLKAWIKRNIGLRDSGTSCFHNYQERFRTLDGRVPCCLQIDGAFPYEKRNNLMTVSLHHCHGKVHLITNTRRWDVSVCFFSAVSDDEDFENDIPAYAKAFRHTDEDGNLFSTFIHDPPTEAEIDRIHTTILQLQRLRPCGCGQPAALSSSGPETDFCVKCELTLTGTPEAVPDEDSNCIICMENIVPGHLSILGCCGVEMHAGCREEYFESSAKCPHCRKPCGY